MGRKSKNQIILDEALKYKDFERERVEEILKAMGSYTQALHPLIETYLDACEVYYIKYQEWKQVGFKSTKQHTNKSGARNEIKHPLAQQVEVWSDKKLKLLNALGLDSKNNKLINTGALLSENKKRPEAQKKESVKNNKLIEFNQMFKKG